MASVAVAKLLGGAGTWLPLAVVFPLAALGMWRLMRHVGLPGRLVAAAFYCVNPWVLDRVAVGHIGLLLGYALLPLVLGAVLQPPDSWPRLAARLSLLLAAMIGLSVHFLWTASVVVLVGLLCSARRSRTAVIACVVAVPLTALCSAYLAISAVAGGAQAWPGSGDLRAFRTLGGTWWEAAGNVLALQGFWRPQPDRPFAVSPAAYWYLAAILLVSLVGIAHALRRGARGQDARLGAAALGLVVIGVALSLGDRGPTGRLYGWLYDDLPLFRVMREPQKFAMLVALGLSVALGLGAEALLGATRQRGAALAGSAFLCALVALYSWPLFSGVHRSVELTRPSSVWQQVDAALAGDPRPALVLPWHLYVGFSWTQGRTIANPAPEFLHHPVVSGDDPELPGASTAGRARSEQVTELIRLGAAGEDVSPRLGGLQVGHVVLLKTADAPAYGWLGRQRGLRSVLDLPEASVWEVTGERAPSARRLSSSAYAVDVERPGEVVLPEAYDPGWRVGSRRPHPSPEGLSAFTLPPGSFTARYAPVDRARVLWALSVASCFALLLLSLLGPGGRLRQDRPSDQQTAPPSARAHRGR